MKFVFEIATDTLMASVVAGTCAISITVVAVMSNNTTTAIAAIATITAVGYSTVGYIKHHHLRRLLV